MEATRPVEPGSVHSRSGLMNGPALRRWAVPMFGGSLSGAGCPCQAEGELRAFGPALSVEPIRERYSGMHPGIRLDLPKLSAVFLLPRKREHEIAVGGRRVGQPCPLLRLQLDLMLHISSKVQGDLPNDQEQKLRVVLPPARYAGTGGEALRDLLP